MSDFPWAYIDTHSSLSASGPTGSVQFRSGDTGGFSNITGSDNFMFHTASGVLAISGTMEVSGTVTANQINVLSQSVVTSHFSASGNTKFGDTTDDIHQFTGSVLTDGALSASGEIFAAGVGELKPAFIVGEDVNITGTIKNTSFISSSGEVYGTSLRASGVDNVSLSVTGTITNSSFISSSGEIFSAGGFRNSGTGNNDIIFSGTFNNKSFTSASGEVFAGGGLRTSGVTGVSVSGTTDFKDTVSVTGSDPEGLRAPFEITGSADSLIVLNTMPGDALKEIAIKKDGTTQSSFGINSDEHVIIENESTKDIILRTQNQNTIRIFGNQQAVEINGSGVTANGTLDVNGSTNITSSLTVSGTVAFGDRRRADASDTLGGGVLSVLGTLTASKGIMLEENSFLPVDKKILLTGSALNSSASFVSSSSRHFSISGSLPGGTILQGGKLTLDHTDAVSFPPALEKGIVLSGAIGGPGSFLGVDNTGKIALSTTVLEVPGGDKAVQFNKDGSFSGSANLQFDYDDNKLTQAGTLEVRSGSSPVVFEVDGEDGITAGRTKLKLVEAWTVNSTHRQNTTRSNQNRFKYMKNTEFPTTSGEQTFNFNTSVLMPNAGRLTKILYRFDHDASGGGTPTFNPATEFRIEMHVAPITQNGTVPNSTTRTIHQATASFAGANVVGGIDLLRDERVTGSWDFGTGSLVGIIMKTSNTNTALGTGFQTYLFEFDHFVEYVSGSGN